MRHFLISDGKEDLLKHFEEFFSISDEKEYDAALTSKLLANVDFKHRFAKYIIWCQGNPGTNFFLGSNCEPDFRLSSFIAYYGMVRLMNFKLEAEEERNLKFLLGLQNYSDGIYLPGLSGNASYEFMPVKMRPGGEFQCGYRLFVVNMMCFRDKKFVMGCRCDSGPIRRMKYNKGCRPLGLKEASKGQLWTLFQVDADLSDDFTAIFSNFLDGDGTVEVCDWVSDSDVRVVFRCDY